MSRTEKENPGNSGTLLAHLQEYCASDHVPFHMPGHKRKPSGMPDPFSIDITEIDGFDDLPHPEGILKSIQENAARLYGAKETFLLVNGSTAGILTAISAACRSAGDPAVILARDSHRSAYHGLYLNQAEPVYLLPDNDRGRPPLKYRLSGTDPSKVREALSRNPQAAAVFVTSPTYDGTVSDISAIAKITHEYGSLLIVDEAHGAHFGLHPNLPETAIRLGADLVIQSLHKTLPSLTQTALLHVCSDRPDAALIRRFLSVYQTSSPSYILLASADRCIRMMHSEGEAVYDRILKELDIFRKKAAGLRHIRILPSDDPTRILISAPGRLSGGRICDTLRHTFHIEPEMVTPSFVLCLVGAGDDAESLGRLWRAVEKIDAAVEADSVAVSGTADDESDSVVPDIYGGEGLPQKVFSLQKAWDAAHEQIPLSESAGRISGTFVYMYPPGTPLLVPGECISRKMISYMETLIGAGCTLHGLESCRDGGCTIRTINPAVPVNGGEKCLNTDMIRSC